MGKREDHAGWTIGTTKHSLHVNPPSFVRRLRHFGIPENLSPGDENLRHKAMWEYLGPTTEADLAF